MTEKLEPLFAFYPVLKYSKLLNAFIESAEQCRSKDCLSSKHKKLQGTLQGILTDFKTFLSARPTLSSSFSENDPEIAQLYQELQSSKGKAKKRRLQKDIQKATRKKQRESQNTTLELRERDFILSESQKITEFINELYEFLLAVIVYLDVANEKETNEITKNIESLTSFSLGSINLGRLLGLSSRYLDKDKFLPNTINEILIILDKFYYLFNLKHYKETVSDPWHKHKRKEKLPFSGNVSAYDYHVERAFQVLSKENLPFAKTFIVPTHFTNLRREYALLLDFIVKGLALVYEKEENIKVVSIPFYFSLSSEDSSNRQVLFHLFYRSGVFASMIDWQEDKPTTRDLLNSYLASREVLHLRHPLQELDAIYHILSTEKTQNLSVTEEQKNAAKSGSRVVDEGGAQVVFGNHPFEAELKSFGLESILIQAVSKKKRDYLKYQVTLKYLDTQIVFYLDNNLDLVLPDDIQVSTYLRQFLRTLGVFYLAEVRDRPARLVKEDRKEKKADVDLVELGLTEKAPKLPQLMVLPLGKGPDHNDMWYSDKWHEDVFSLGFEFTLPELNAVFLQAQLAYLDRSFKSVFLIQDEDEEDSPFFRLDLTSVVADAIETIQNKGVLNDYNSDTIEALKLTVERLMERVVNAEPRIANLLGLDREKKISAIDRLQKANSFQSLVGSEPSELKARAKKFQFYLVTYVDAEVSDHDPVLVKAREESLDKLITPPARKTDGVE